MTLRALLLSLLLALALPVAAQSGSSSSRPATPAGTAALPGLYFSGDRNTGLYSPGADSAAVTAGGAARLTVTTSGAAVTGDLSATGNIAATGNLTASGYEPAEYLLATTTASASAQVDFVLTSYTAFRHFRVEFDGVRPSVDEGQLWFRVSEDGGSTFKAGASDYSYSHNRTDTPGTNNPAGSAGTAQIPVIGSGINTGAASDSGAGSVTVFHPAGTSLHKRILYSASSTSGTETNAVVGGARYRGTTNAVNAIRFLPDSGNIASGTFKLYGIK